jgi:acyl-CoA synthetase (AMP-forming)/AMP-acid ligase II
MEILTAAESTDQQRRIAGGLIAGGVRAGDRVALQTTSCGLMLSGILGALRVGIVPVLLNAGLLDHERVALLDDAGPVRVIDDADLALLASSEPTDLAPHPLGRPMHYTSGTTGEPKGVWTGLLDDADAAALVGEEADLWQFDANDRHLVCSPFHHSVAIRFGGGTLLAGGSVVILGAFDAHAAARAIALHRPTTTFMVPAHLQRLFALDELPPLGSFRLAVHAGAPCPPSLKHAAIEAFGLDRVWEFYGSTEGQFTACSAADWLHHRGSVGRARRHRELTADDDGTIWCEVPPYARFEYWRDPAKTARAWRPPRHEGAYGVFTVGDLGRLDADDYLYLDGRRDDLIITGGVNVYPMEIERAMADHPGIAQVGVFGLDDERWGQRVCAAVVGTATPEDVVVYARSRLAPYKCPKDVFIVDQLPLTSTGKLQRSRLPELLKGAD